MTLLSVASTPPSKLQPVTRSRGSITESQLTDSGA